MLAGTLQETRRAARATNGCNDAGRNCPRVRNPLGGLELYAPGLLREALGGQQRLGGWRASSARSDFKQVVSEFLEFARRPPPRLEPIALGPLFEEIRELCQSPDGGTISVAAPNDLAVQADAGQLRRALLNLARNAAAAARKGHVEIAARRSDGRVHIEVRDDGPGVAPELREKIFTPFFTTREKGTGLGLAFVREIVRDHGGDVMVRDAPGGGSVFGFDLPAAEESEDSEEDSSSSGLA